MFASFCYVHTKQTKNCMWCNLPHIDSRTNVQSSVKVYNDSQFDTTYTCISFKALMNIVWPSTTNLAHPSQSGYTTMCIPCLFQMRATHSRRVVTTSPRCASELQSLLFAFTDQQSLSTNIGPVMWPTYMIFVTRVIHNSLPTTWPKGHPCLPNNR